MPLGTITQADQEFIETWENISTAQNAIIHFDPRGDETQEMIVGRRRFLVTSQERMVMQERIVDSANDPFLNGAFRPVIVPDTVDTKSNPNALSDEEIQSIFVSSKLAWQEWLAVIDSPETLRRMLDLADGDEVDIPHRRYNELRDRLLAVKPKTQVTQKDRAEYEKMAGGGPAATTTAAPQRRRGGMSADYR